MMDFHGVSEAAYSKQVSDKHLVDISHSCCGQWRTLPSGLEMRTIMAEDIDRSALDEAGKRLAFLKKWKQVKGMSATYRQLISALLEIDCRDDAECVCKLLQKSEGVALAASIADQSQAGMYESLTGE